MMVARRSHLHKILQSVLHNLCIGIQSDSVDIPTQSPCNTGESNFHAGYSWGETARLALAPNSVFSEVMVEKKSLDSANEGEGSILESPQKEIRYSGVLGQAGSLFP